jgi:hypothetical protein
MNFGEHGSLVVVGKGVATTESNGKQQMELYYIMFFGALVSSIHDSSLSYEAGAVSE